MAQGEIYQDARGVIPPNEAVKLRKIRAEEAWNRFDTLCIGQNAEASSVDWFNTWAAFANADEYQWFSGRSGNVGTSYTNQTTERTDWAQDIYFVSIQLIAPPGIADLESDPNDALTIPMLFMQYLPKMLALRLVLAESDEISHAPADQYPSGFGVSYAAVASAAAPVVSAGNNGEPIISNMWKFPEPITLAAKAKITLKGRLDQPMRGLLQNIGGPGVKRVPTGFAPPNDFRDMENRYMIRATLIGPRFLQLRGARSSA